MGDLDTLRWGDSQQLIIPGGAGGRFAAIQTSKQLIAAHWRWPCVWALRVIIRPQLDEHETATIFCAVDVIVGSGQSQATARFLYNVALVAGAYAPINDLQLIPACDIQATVLILGSQALVGTAEESIAFGLFVAPHSEPHAITRYYEKTIEEHGGESRRWMDANPAQGFQDEPLHYKPR